MSGYTPFQHQTRPENAEEAARELLAIDQPNAALDLLAKVLSSRRHKTWSPIHEDLMKLYLDICVSLKLNRQVKDGLHQYRNLCQQQAPNSLSVIIQYLLDLVKELPTKDLVVDGVVEEKSLSNPSELLMKTLNPPTNEIYVNVKFVSEAHRSILDILKTHSKLSNVYQKTACLSLDFFADLGRKSDLKRMCEFLRAHITNLQRYGSKVNSSDSKSMRNWDGWNENVLSAILKTKLKILRLCQKLNIPSEIYRSLEDIHSLRKLGNRMQINNAMAEGSEFSREYHKILATVCLVNGDHYIVGLILAKLLDNELAAEEKDAERIAELANTMVLCTICSPSKPTSRQVKLIHLIHSIVKLDLSDEIDQKGYLQYCDDGVKELYNTNSSMRLLQVDDLSGLLENIKGAPIFKFENTEEPELETPLRTTLATKYLKMLSQYYSVVKISTLISKFEGVISRGDLEKIMINIGKVDWRNDALIFQPQDNRDWVVNVAKSLSKVQVTPSPQVNIAYFEEIKAGLDEENKAYVSRKNIIEREKEEMERKQMEESMEAAAKLEAEREKRKAEEKSRLALEEKKRELEKQKKIHDEMQEMEKKKYLAALGESSEGIDHDLSVEELARKHQEKLQKKKEKQEKNLSLRLKKLDYTIRAIRDEERKVIREERDDRVKAHKEKYEKDVIQKAAEDKKAWESAIERKKSLLAMNVFDFTANFEKKITSREEAKFEHIKEECDKEAEQYARAQKLKRAKKRREKEIEAEKEKARQAELEAIRLAKEKEEEEKRAKEEEAKKKEEERMRIMEGKKLAEQRSSTAYVPPSRRGRDNSFRDTGGSRFGDRGRDGGFNSRDRFRSDTGSSGRYVPPSRRGGDMGRSNEGPRENSRWR